MRHSSNRTGFSILGVVVGIALLSAMAASLLVMVGGNQQTRIQQITTDQSFYSSQAGLELALGLLKNDRPQLGIAMTRQIQLGTGNVVNISTSLVEAKVRISTTVGNSTTVLQITNSGPQSNCLTVGFAAAYLELTANALKDLKGLTVQTNCVGPGPGPIRLDKMTVSWIPTAPARQLNGVRINGVDLYNGAADTGIQFEVDHVIPDGATHAVDFIRFSAEMLGRDYTIVWMLEDGTTKSTTVDLFADNQQSCLTVNTAAAAKNVDKLQGVTLQNNLCALDMGVTGVTVSWADEPTQRVKKIQIAGTTVFSGTAASGVLADFGNDDVYLRNEVGSNLKAIDFIEFQNEVILGRDYILNFALVDGTTKSATVHLAGQSDNLTIDRTGAVFDAGNLNLTGVLLGNNGASAITIDKVVVSWTGVPGNRRLSDVFIPDTTNVFSGNKASGAETDITDVNLNAGVSGVTTKFRFNNDMGGATGTISIQFVMGDGSVKTVTALP